VAVVLLPSLLAAEAGGRSRFQLDEAATVGDALRSLPVSDLLFDERGELRRLVNVYVDGRDVRLDHGVETRLGEDATVRVIAAIAGG
jgi:molybdopterin synthase sulfur carrier subunit